MALKSQNANFRFLTVLIGLSASSLAQAEVASCAKATLKSGDKCKNLDVQFDVSACHDNAPSRKAELKCKNRQAVAVYSTAAYKYEVDLEKSEGGAWGSAAAWAVKGDVRRSGIPAARAAAAVAPKHTAEAVVPPPAPAPASTEAATTAPQLGFSGLLDVYYTFNSLQPKPPSMPSFPSVSGGTNGDPTLPASQNIGRNFDLYHNQFGLNLVELSVKRTSQNLSFKVDFDFGEMADATHRVGTGVVDEVSKHVGQAVVSWTPSSAPDFTLNVGKMATHVGLEVTKAKDNWNYSRSFLFALAIPYWHTGVNAAYAVIPGQATLGVYLYNGWNNVYDNNTGKTLGFQASLTPIDGLAMIYNFITGPEQANNDSAYRTVHEANATWTLSPEFALAGDVVYGKDSTAGTKAVWMGGTLAAKWSFGSMYLSPRIEYYKDRNGFTSGTAQNLDSMTLTFNKTVAEGFDTRVELRRDHASAKSFKKGDGTTTNAQMTGTLAALYAF